MLRMVTPLATLIVLTAIGSTAEAGAYSFTIGGHRVHVEAPRNCRSTSCVSVSAPGLFARKRDDDTAAAPAVAPPPVPIAAAPPPACPAVPATPAAPIVAPAPVLPPPPAAPMLAPATTQDVVPPPPPKLDPPPVEPRIVPVSRAAAEEPADAPLGTWDTEGGKGTVRIERCGGALCGYVLEASWRKGESVLVNMRPKSDSVWTGSVYSRDRGNTYYARMTLKGRDKLRVEACALGHLFCTGNDWTRVEERQERLRDRLLTTSRQSGSTGS